MLGRRWIGIVELESRLHKVTLARQRGIVGVIDDVAKTRESLAAGGVIHKSRDTDRARQRQVLELIAEAQFREAADRNPEIQTSAGIVLPERGNPIVIEVKVKRLGVCEQAWRNKEVTEPVERMVVLGGGAVGRTDNKVIAHLGAESSDVV